MQKKIDASTPNSSRNIRFAFLLIGIGVLSAAESYTGIPVISRLWPVIPLLLGTGLIGIHIKRRTSSVSFLAVGEYIVCFSCLALYCNFTSWGNMVRFWPLFIGFFGVVFLTLFLLDREKRILSFLGSLSVSITAFFYFIIAVDVRFWWTSFVFVGLSILFSVRIR